MLLNLVQEGLIRIGKFAALAKGLFQSTQTLGKRLYFFSHNFGSRVDHLLYPLFKIYTRE